MIGLLVTVLLFPLVGWAMSRLVGRTSVFLMGLGTVGAVLHVTTLMRIPPMVTIVVLIVGSLIVIGARVSSRAHAAEDSRAPFALVVLLLPIAALLFITAVTPLHDYDGRAFWLLKAKAISTEHRIDGPFFQQQTVHDPRNEYPLLIPMDAAAVMMLSGEVDDRAVRWIYVLALAALALHARRFAGDWPAALIPWIPQFAIANSGGAVSAYNDIPLAGFIACAFFELVERTSPLRFGLWLSFLVLTKNEGLPIAIILLVAGGFVFGRRVLLSLAPFAVAAIALLVWRGLVPASDEENLPRLLTGIQHHIDRLVPAVARFIAHACTMQWWGLFWIAAVAAAIYVGTRELKLPLYIAGAIFALYVAVYMVTTWNMLELMNASADRLLMHMIGPVIYIIGACARSR